MHRAGTCAEQIGGRVEFYSTHATVDDIADVLDALHIGKVDFYGDSYGSYVGQAFAVRHGDHLRSLVLDGTYPLPGLNADGERIPVRVDEPSLVIVLQSGYANYTVYRDLLAAIRSFDAGDRAPLLRLIAENTLDPTPAPLRGSSEALYLAVTCHDYPQMWDPAAPFGARETQLAAARAALPAAQFRPFSPLEWTDVEYEGATACLRWPGPRRPDPPAPPDAPYPSVPTLVVNGDLDNITASSGARVVAARFPHSTFVETHNTIHVSALGDRDDCAAPIVRRFVATLDAGDTSCATRIAEVRTVDRFPRTAAAAERPTRGREMRASRSRAVPPPWRRRRWPTRCSAGR